MITLFKGFNVYLISIKIRAPLIFAHLACAKIKGSKVVHVLESMCVDFPKSFFYQALQLSFIYQSLKSYEKAEKSVMQFLIHTIN